MDFQAEIRRLFIMNWLLVVVMAILLVNALIGLKAGFIKTAFSLCSLILAIILTAWLSPYVNNFMKGNVTIYNSISSKVEKMLQFDDEEYSESKQESLIDELHLPKSIKESLKENNNAQVYKDMELGINNFKGYVVSYITGLIINAISFIATFAVILILLWVLCIALDIVSKLPLLNQINKLAGLAAGLLHGLVIVWILFILLTVFGSSSFGQEAMQMIEEDVVLSFLYDNNILLRFITNIAKMIL